MTAVGSEARLGGSLPTDVQSGRTAIMMMHPSAIERRAVTKNQENQAGDISTYRAYLLRYAMLHLRDESQAEDVVQETLAAALLRRDQFAGRAHLRTWLTGILKHKIVDQVRRSARTAAREVSHDFSDEDLSSRPSEFTTGGQWIDPPRRWAAPDAAMESGQFWRVYEECCRHMPKRHALAFSMREVMEMTSEDICESLGISQGNLNVILFRARLRLRACLTENWFNLRDA